MKVISGKVPGFEYAVLKGDCSFCERVDTNVLRVSIAASICEACSVLVGWAWRQVEGIGLPGAAYTTDVKFVLLLVVREREGDSITPFDVLMVGRKDEDNVFGVPGGKVEPNEKAEVAAVREFGEETGLVTWPAALEPIYTAYSPRSSLGRVYLVRGYYGEIPRSGVNAEGQKIGWKPWPPMNHARHLAGVYIGVAEAFNLRWRLQKLAAATTPMTVRLGRPAVDYLNLKLSPMPDMKDEFALSERVRSLEGFSNVMTSDETEIVRLIATLEERRAGELVVRKKPLPVAPPRPPEPAEGEGADEGEFPSAEGEADDPPHDEEPPPAEPTEVDTAGGFARPSTSVRRGP